MRMLVIKQETDLQALSTRLLSARLSSGKAESAIESLRALNPHLDLQKLAAGTVLLVPDTPSFKASASSSVAADVFDGFEQLVRSGLDAAAAKLKAGNEARAAQHADVAAVLKTSTVKRVIESDAELKQQLEAETKTFKEDQQRAAEAEQMLQDATKGARIDLAFLSKLLG